MKYVDDFKKWAREQYDEYMSDYDYIQGYANEELEVCGCMNLKTQKAAFAKCHVDDEFNSSLGIGVAYAKLMGREIPRELKSTLLANLSTGDHFMTHNVNFIVVGRSPQFRNRYVCEQKDTEDIYYFDTTIFVHKID